MKKLQNELHRVLGEVPRQILSEMISEKLCAAGVTLSNSQTRRLESRILDDDSVGDTIEMSFRRWQWWKKTTVDLEFTQEDCDKIERDFDRFINEELGALIKSISAELAVEIFATLKKNWPQEFRRQSRDYKSFRKRLADRWGNALAALRMLLTISREFGETINHDLRSHEGTVDWHLIEVMTRLHARACQVTEEVVCLLEAGLADGAMARWRTLHEIAAVALLMDMHGEELAERYVSHEIVESRRAAKQYEKYYGRLGQEAPDQSEIQNVERSYAAVIAKFGREFRSQYGWAAHHLGNPNPNFSDIEIASKIDHLRPYYKMASYNVHANPKGMYFKLGLLSEADVLLAGPSNAGLIDPGHSAAISLMQISVAVGMLDLTLDNLVIMQIMSTLVDEVGQAFEDAGIRLEQDEEEITKNGG